MKSVTICSSNRFAEEAENFGKKLKELGVTVYIPHYYTKNYGGLSNIKEEHNKKFIAIGLTLDHFQKIRKGDVIFIYNKDGYSGVSTTLEIGFATALDKPIYAFSDKDSEECRDILFQGYFQDPEDLFKILK